MLLLQLLKVLSKNKVLYHLNLLWMLKWGTGFWTLPSQLLVFRNLHLRKGFGRLGCLLDSLIVLIVKSLFSLKLARVP